MRKSTTHSPRRPVVTFGGDENGASAVEFSIVVMPFILVLLMGLQISIYFMTQSSLDAGVVQAADALVEIYYSGNTPVIPTPAALKALVVAKSGGLVRTGMLKVELRKFTALTNARLSIVDGTQDANVANDIMALRAEATVTGLVPGFSALTVVRSSALVRRQGQ